MPFPHFIRSFTTCLFLFLLSPLAFTNESLLVLGDSLSAAYQIPIDAGWVKLLEKKIQENYNDWQVINASIVGDTTANGLQRLPPLLKEYHPAIVILELGGNDGLRGLPLSDIEKNLRTLIELIDKSGAKILLVGIKLPPNYGPTYTNGFADIYTQLSQQYHLSLVPFLLEGIALNPGLMQDGIHPTAKAQPLIVDNVWPYLEPMLRD